MKHVGKTSVGFLLLGATLALTACNLGSSNGNNTADSGSAPLPVQPLAYTGATGSGTIPGDNTNGQQDALGNGAAGATGGLINNAAGGGVGGLFSLPTSVVSTSDGNSRASNATIQALFGSLNLSGLTNPASVTSQEYTNPVPCAVPAGDIQYYLSGQYIVVSFAAACMKILPSSGEATVNGVLVVYISQDGSTSTFTPSNLTIEDNSATTTYNIPAATYELDNNVLSILMHCESGKVCKITVPSAPTQTGGAWSFSGATFYDPTLGSFSVSGSSLLLCAAGAGGTTNSPFQSGTVDLWDSTYQIVITFNGCGATPTFVYSPFT